MGYFSGRSVLVTGGGSGIGRRIAVDFAEAGARVVIAGRREEALAATVAMHPAITACAGDIGSSADAQRMVAAALDQSGGLDVLVNNAGPLVNMTLQESNPVQIRELFDTTVIGTTLVTQAAAGALRARRGAVVNITNGIAATGRGHGAPGAGFTSAAKAALESLTRTWAVELAPEVRVNAVAPGLVRSWENDADHPAELLERFEALGRSSPAGRIGVPADIAYWVLALADSNSGWTTGQSIVADGGFYTA
jgi:NAD(P)-dependent dehydrogenase (short-subunit alcohol dehydrogenase family)